MAKGRRSVVSTDKHTLRLIQQVAAGTAGAYHDSTFGRYWQATPRHGSGQGLNGAGGFVEIEEDPILNDAGQFTIQLADTGSDGRSHRDRFYLFTDTPDPQNPGQTVPYMPGDEWVEIYRGHNELIAVGTPISEQSSPGQIQIVCADAIETLKKQRETAAGFWKHSVRDVFEHYTRLWTAVAASNFPNQLANFPFVTGASTDGSWRYLNVQAADSGPLTLQATAGAVARIRSTHGWSDAGAVDHSCWRVETRISSLISTSTSTVTLRIGFPNVGAPDLPAQPGITFQIAPAGGNVSITTQAWGGGTTTWPVNVAGLLDSAGQMQPPYTLTVEARERFICFYLDGQLVAIANRPFPNAPSSSTAPRTYFAELEAGGGAMTATVDYMVIRQTTPPLNGGVAGDYALAGTPDQGGLQGEYFDLSDLVGAPSGQGFALGDPSRTPASVRVDTGVYFPFALAPMPGWFPSAVGAAQRAFIRWTGSIYLPLADQDVHFNIPTGGSWQGQALWVGRTRKGEAIATNGVRSEFYPGFGETTNTTSVGMRSLLGRKNGWYPIVFEFYWNGGASSVGGIVGFGYDVSTSITPLPTALSPTGCFNQQIPNGDSHYDTLQTTLGQAFAIQYKAQPRQLESGAFPAAIIPNIRVGRDTDYILDDAQAVNPQETSKAEDNATTTLAQAQGLGGSNAGNIWAEVFNYPVLASHPFVLSEAENLPQVADTQMLLLLLATLLGLRSESWQSVQADSIGQRQMQDTFPLTGQLAEFDWQPGDGLRISLPQIGVLDTTPRQIFSLKRMLYQDGMGASTASFRDRPRNFEQTIRRFIRQVLADRRTFQGQLAYSPGQPATGPTDAQVALPADLALVRSAELVITQKSDGSAWNVYVNGAATGQQVTGTGTLDLSGFIARNNATEPRMLVHLQDGTGTVSYMLRLLEFVPKA